MLCCLACTLTRSLASLSMYKPNKSGLRHLKVYTVMLQISVVTQSLVSSLQTTLHCFPCLNIQTAINEVEQFCDSHGLTVNACKTKVVVYGEGEQGNWTY